LRCLRWPLGVRSCGEIVRRDVCPDSQRLEDISSIRDAMRQISQEASVAVDLLDAKVEDGLLDGRTEAGDVRAILELIQSLTLGVSEELDAYQDRYSGP
jgi:hypothetical protein